MLNARSVLVTGSNRGIGLELIRQLLGNSKRPEWIFATCRDPEGPRAQELKKLAAQHHEVKIIPLEITDSSSIQAAVTKVTDLLQGAGLNLLINNAGMAKSRTMESETAEDMAEVYRNNVIGPMMVTQALFLPLLRKASRESRQKGMSCSKAAIINVSSEGGSITNILIFDLMPCVSYRCSKAALNMLTRCQSLGYAEDEILCIALHPGWVQTDMGGSMATMPVDASARAILNTLGRLTEKDNGTFVNWEGAGVPW
ncbi:PREDICTED: C-factor-like isoform X1 [Gekko japonicus]|uniref:C-factor-like isoform X1 n=1 Tax=Gekko japonicus TaxID=146911 RepID=A0ABM1L2T8_GEKJA|nr:PREDICTED: C-factor-like isoform X1 [Gekko japonicus]